MKNNKLKTNFLQKGASKIGGKLAKLIPPAILTAAMLNFASCASTTGIQNRQEIKESTPIYRNAVAQFESNTKGLETIYNSKLYNKQKYDTLEVEVRNELAQILAAMNKETLKLSTAYKVMEDQSLVNSNLSEAEITAIAKARGANTADEINLAVAKGEIQHYLHLMLDTLTMIRLGANEAEIAVLDENDSHNEYLRFNTKGERDLRKESDAVLDSTQKDILAYTDYGYNVTNKDGRAAANAVENSLNKIKSLATSGNQTRSTYREIIDLIDQTAALLPSSLFGNLAMRKALIIEFVKQYLTNAMLTNLEKIGYDINNLKAGEIISARKNTLNGVQVRGNYLDNDRNVAALTVGADGKTTWANKPNFDLKYGGELGFDLGDNFSFQVLGKVEPGFTTAKKNHHLSFPVKAGINVDNNAQVSTPFGLGAIYSIPIGKFSLDFGVSSLANLQKSNVRLGGMIAATYDTGKVKIQFGFGYEHTISWDQTMTMSANEPIGPVDPIDPGKPDEPTEPDKPIGPINPDDDRPIIDEGYTNPIPTEPTIDLDTLK